MPSEIVPIIGIEVRFLIQNTNLLHCSLDRYTPKVFSAYKSVHAAIVPLPSLDTCCTWGTETTSCGYERGPTVELKSHLLSFFLLLGRASPHPLCFDVLEESWCGQNYLPLHSLILGLVPGIS